MTDAVDLEVRGCDSEANEEAESPAAEGETRESRESGSARRLRARRRDPGRIWVESGRHPKGHASAAELSGLRMSLFG